MSALPFGYTWDRVGTTSDSSAMSCQVSWMPAAWAIAGMCRVWLVEPPVACRATMELTRDFSSTISPSGMKSPLALVMRVTCCAASMVRASRSGVYGLTNEAPGRCRPITSINNWLVLAVP
ncbi:hypothetical protein D3C77_468160 [compost metagenome]